MSAYKNAADCLPPHLLAELQRYVAGEQIYVPRPVGRRGWGERSGARQLLAQRNREICKRWTEGTTIEGLMVEFHLSHDSIRKILAGKNSSSHIRG